jgi:hypothetical protein
MATYSNITDRIAAEEKQEWKILQILASQLHNKATDESKQLFNLQLKKWLMLSRTTIRLAKQDQFRIQLTKIEFN